jgi:hypothetical protein
MKGLPCFVCSGECLGHDSIEPGDTFRSVITTGVVNDWRVVWVSEDGQHAEVYALDRPNDHYYWHTDSLRLMERV